VNRNNLRNLLGLLATSFIPRKGYVGLVARYRKNDIRKIYGVTNVTLALVVSLYTKYRVPASPDLKQAAIMAEGLTGRFL